MIKEILNYALLFILILQIMQELKFDEKTSYIYSTIGLLIIYLCDKKLKEIRLENMDPDMEYDNLDINMMNIDNVLLSQPSKYKSLKKIESEDKTYPIYCDGGKTPGYYLANNGEYEKEIPFDKIKDLIKASKYNDLYNQHNHNIIMSPHTHVGKKRSYMNWNPILKQ